MWAKLDDALLDHRKILEAGHRLGKNGCGVALGFFTAGLLYSNKHLTNGFLSTAVVEGMRFAEKPLDAAAVMVKVGLWEAVEGGFRVHDFLDYNLDSTTVHAKRKADRERKRNGGRNRHVGRA